ncbi:MAG: MgtC/SapB family protein [Sedimentitalea sp.]|nr:MgtC/SapB family protein [Sedimentitalea sp.]
MVEFPEFILRTLVAAICGLVVGLDREIKNKPLGARAYILVALGSAALMVVTLNFSLSSMASDKDLTMDPTRLIQGIVGGIGFLGAGAIMTRDQTGRLRGVGSGAAIWGAGAIGVACGLGYFKEAAFVAATIFAILNLHDWFLHIADRHTTNGTDDDTD